MSEQKTQFSKHSLLFIDLVPLISFKIGFFFTTI